MHVDPSYFGAPATNEPPPDFRQQRKIAQDKAKAMAVATPDTDALIASWTPQWLIAGEVRGLLRNAAGAAKSLKSRIQGPGYAPIADSLRTLADVAAQSAGKAPDEHPLSLEQTVNVVGSAAAFWKIAHLAATAAKTTLDFRPTQKILQGAQTRKEPPPVTLAAGETSTGIPGWGWAVIGGVVVAIIGGTIWYFKSRKKSLEGADELPELYPDDAEAA